MAPDLIIAGGGPAGLAASLYALAAGLSVQVHEPRPGVVDKACGEGVMPAGVARLHGLGVHPRGMEFVGIRYRSTGRVAQTRFRGPPGLGVRRTELHRALRRAVLEAGIPILPRRVRAVQQRPDGVLVDGTPAGYLIVADGLHSRLRTTLGMAGRPRGPRRYGLRQHVRRAPWTDHVEVHWSAHSEAYITPVAPDQVGIAILTSTRAPFRTQLDAFPEVQELLADAPPASPVRGAGPLRQSSNRRVLGRILAVGDASGYLDAITGEGISLALAQADAAVTAIATGRPGSYERRWHQIMRRHHLLTRALMVASASPLRPHLVPAAQKLPWLFAAAVNEVGRP